jgi:putative phosphoesterase
MSHETYTVWPVDGTKVAVLADCHIHSGGGPAFPEALFAELVGADLIVTLGDMGEAAGLDQLAEIAPVIGVRGADDSDDPRTHSKLLVLTSPGSNIGCVFDPVAAGLAASADPFLPVPDFDEVSKRVFGRHVQMLLFASTHRKAMETFGDVGLAINPGSAVLPADGEPPSFLRLTVIDGGIWVGNFVPLD